MIPSNSIFLFLNLSGGEIAIVFLFVLFFFGAESIPKIARTFGKVIYQIKNATDDIKREIKDSTDNIKQDVMDQVGMGEEANPLKDITSEITKEVDNSLKEIKE